MESTKIDLSNYNDNLLIQDLNFMTLEIYNKIKKIENKETKKEMIQAIINFLNFELI